MEGVSRRRFLRAAGLAAASISYGGVSGGVDRARQPPNVIVILTDDQGYGDLGVNGNTHLDTPNLDRFAREGVRFTRFYCSPVCAPTRASLMTGRYYYRTGVIHTSRGGAKMAGAEITLAGILGKAGYATGIFGKWHLGDNYPMRPQDQGFNENLVHKAGGIGQAPDQPNHYQDPMLWHNGRRVSASGYCTDVFTNAAMAFIEAQRDGPFFVYLPTNAPHTPLEIAPAYYEPYIAKGLDETTAKVYGMIANLDENIGRLLAHLDKLDLRENTLVFFMGDNGPQQARYIGGLRGRKSSVYEGGIRVPCLAQWPSRWRGERCVDRVAAHIDIVPTVLDAAGLDVPDGIALDGKSLVPLLEQDGVPWPDRTLFFQCHRGLTPKRYQNCAAVTQQYKLVGCPGTFSKEGLDPSTAPALELYDIEADPGEKEDLATERPYVTAALKKAYEAWFADVESSRHFRPGTIHIGSVHENPCHLCRYQDSAYVGGKPTGWPVYIEREGRYRIAINRGPSRGPGQMFVRVDDAVTTAPLGVDADEATVVLPKGEAMLEVWIQEDGQERSVPTKNDTVGDVTITALDL